MSNNPLENKLSRLGYSPSLEESGFDIHETLAEVVKTPSAIYWEGFPVLFANAAKDAAFDHIKIKNLLTTVHERKIYQDLMLLALAVYRVHGFESAWAEALEGALSAEDKTQLETLSTQIAAGNDVNLAGCTLTAVRINKAFVFFLAREIQDKKKAEENEQEAALEKSLSEVFSSKQKEIFRKKLNKETLSKTEREYFSRVIRKKLVALANSDLHRLSKKILGKLYGFILFAFFASVTLCSTQALAAKDFNVKNDTQSFMFVSGTTGNVGVNTTVPRAKLEVDGTIYGMNIGVNTIAPAATLEIERSGTTAPLMVSTSGNDGNLLVVTSAGNVGIGSTGPIGKLDVIDGDLRLGRSDTSSYYAKFRVNWDSDSAFQLFGAGNVELFRQNWTANALSLVPVAGNVGIGSTAPVAKLDVTGGAVRVWTGAGTVDYATNSGDMYVQGNLEVDGNVYLGDAIADTLTVAGNLTLAGTTSYTGAVSVSTTSTSAFAVKTTGGASTILNVDTSGSNISLVGNVGINTTVPLANLEVVKTAGTAPLKISSAAGGAGDYLIVSSSGNVGVGTSMPSGKLHMTGVLRDLMWDAVNSSLKIGATAGQDTITVTGTIAVEGTGGPLKLYPNYVYGASGASLSYWNGASISRALRWTTSGDILVETGNVGVNTTVPRAKLEVDGTIYGMNIGVNSTVPGALLDIKADGSSRPFAVSNSAVGDYMVVASSGNVGIGENSPGAPLHIKSSNAGAVTDHANAVLILEKGSQPTLQFQSANTQSAVGIVFGDPENNDIGRVLYNHILDELNFYTNDTLKVVFSSGGNVGIGSASPAAKLDVTGGAARVWTGAGTVDYATNSGDMYVQGNLEIDGNVYLGDAITDNLTVAGNLTLAGSTTYTGSVAISTTTTTAFTVKTSGGTNIFNVDSTNGRSNLVGLVGINTTTPAANLEVVKTAGVAPLRISSAPGTVGNYLLVDSTGNVGIGNLAPMAKLSIVSTGDGANGLLYLASSSTSARGTLARLGYYSYMNMHSSGTTFWNWGARYDGEADVWVRTYTGADNYLPYVSLSTGNTVLIGGALSNSSGDTNPTMNAKFTFDVASGNLGVGAGVPRAKLEVDGTIYGMNIGVNTIAPAATLEVERSVGASPFMVSTTANDGDLFIITSSGKVGIGTTTAPMARLDVGGNSQSSPQISARKIGNSLEFGHPNSAGYASTLGGTSLGGFPFIAFNAEADISGNTYTTRGIMGRVLQNNTSGTLSFGRLTNPNASGQTPTTDFAIDSNGNIGIGSASPTGILDVRGGAARVWTGAGTVDYATNSGDMYVQGNLEVDGNVYLGDAIADTLTVAGNLTLAGSTTYTGAVSISTTSTSAFSVKTTGGGTTLLNVDTSGSNISLVGNVGINTTVPLANLEVVKTAGVAPLKISSAAGGAGDYVVVTSSGNVGIGSTNPQASLQVQGNQFIGNASGVGGGLVVYGGGSQAISPVSGRIRIAHPAYNEYFEMYYANNSELYLSASSVENRSLYIANTGAGTVNLIVNDGNVGIGTAAPQEKLQVDGAVYVARITTPASATDRLYNSGGKLYWSGSPLATGNGIVWNDVSGTTQTMEENNGYIADNASQVTFTLPATIQVGSVLHVTGGVAGVSGWKIAQNDGQQIHYSSVSTTTGSGGYLASTGQYDSVQLLCVKANTDFVVIASVGNISYN